MKNKIFYLFVSVLAIVVMFVSNNGNYRFVNLGNENTGSSRTHAESRQWLTSPEVNRIMKVRVNINSPEPIKSPKNDAWSENEERELKTVIHQILRIPLKTIIRYGSKRSFIINHLSERSDGRVIC